MTNRRRRRRPTSMDLDWMRMRGVHLQTYPECRACGSTEDIVVHHLRYRGKRGKSELPGDLMTLCKQHHDDFHRSLGRTGTGVAETIRYVQQVWSYEDAGLMR